MGAKGCWVVMATDTPFTLSFCTEPETAKPSPRGGDGSQSWEGLHRPSCLDPGQCSPSLSPNSHFLSQPRDPRRPDPALVTGEEEPLLLISPGNSFCSFSMEILGGVRIPRGKWEPEEGADHGLKAFCRNAVLKINANELFAAVLPEVRGSHNGAE